MPNKLAAKKSLRQAKKLTLKNFQSKRQIKDLGKKIVKAAVAGEGQVKEQLSQFQKRVDKAVKSGWLKKNAGNRKKSRLLVQVRKLIKK
ncbi:MAG: 30S ribosomal protein S20 [Candidatus Komeilibacteria bacterium]|nr:30S ribosomal protein S20 [Candidatus Komeilibacteria bacterium]